MDRRIGTLFVALGLLLAAISPGCGSEQPAGENGDQDTAGDPDLEPEETTSEPDLAPVFPRAETEPYCQAYCTDLAACGLLETSEADCVDQCLADLEQDLVWFGRIECVRQVECSEISTCIEGPIEDRSECASFADLVEQCDAYWVFESIDDPRVARWTCNGYLAGAVDDPTTTIGCITDQLRNDCDALGILTTCLGYQEDLCAGICQRMESCPEGTPGQQMFYNQGACESFCHGLNGGQLFSFALCVEMGQCNAEQCHLIPSSPRSSCSQACTAATSLCGTGSGLFGSQQACEWLCEAVHGVFSVADSAGAADCFDSMDTQCPSLSGQDDDEFGQARYALALTYCMFWDADCAQICEAIGPCSAQDFDPYTCGMECYWYYAGNPGLTGDIRECMDGISGTGLTECARRFECYPPSLSDSIATACLKACARFEPGRECDHIEPMDGCYQTCFEAFSNQGLGGVATVTCAQFAACDQVTERCFPETVELDTDCVSCCTAEASLTHPCADWDYLMPADPASPMCSLTCTGMAMALGEDLDACSCVQALGRNCQADLRACTAPDVF